jgi:1-acyl-sn-glycerol-3-phosphate acyltransferase
MLCMRPVWRGRDNIPTSGAVLLAANHLSNIDPITLTAYVLAAGRIPRYMAKASLWDSRVTRRVMVDGRHIPVYRDEASRGELRGSAGFRELLRSLKEGECVVVFPEGTFSDDPLGWPMAGKTGVARMALRTGTPVIPIAHWGGQRLLPPDATLPRVIPRPTVHTVAGPPVDLDDLRGGRLTEEVLQTATKRIMSAITALLAEVREEQPPARPDDPDHPA